VAVLTIAGLSVPRLRILGKLMSTLLLVVTGLLGCLILVMWFATNHQGCGNNFNLFWALPTNVIIAFFNPKGKGRYALIAFVLVLASFVLHFMKVQGIIIELMPVLIALMFIYGTIYRNSTIKTIANA
jgi:4-amino-4-deoxy-L-arabinose transferase-like glycosyltransferase